MTEQEPRIRNLETKVAEVSARLDNVEGRQKDAYHEIKDMREELKEANRQIMTAIYGSRIAATATNTTAKVLMWGIGTSIAFWGVLSGVAMAIKRMFFSE